jgi:hypothetical protein
MTVTISVNADHINTLDLKPAQSKIELLLKDKSIATWEQQVQFRIDYPRDPSDPRELPEIPEVRLWFIRLDSRYPWLPFLLDWKTGELSRYTAMLVPHQFHPQDGIQYNLEALEIFVMQKVFVMSAWLKAQGIEGKSKLKAMAKMLGYDLEDDLFDLISSLQ